MGRLLPYKCNDSHIIYFNSKSRSTCLPSNITNVLVWVYTTSKSDSFRVLPPSLDALKLHIKRCSYQAGWIWGNTMSQKQSYPPTEWGWHIHHEQLMFTWTTTSSLGTQILKKLIKTCKCTTAKCTDCSCADVGKCLKFCTCKQKCTKTPKQKVSRQQPDLPMD